MLPWYKKGLRFGCTGCGKCCTGSPGVVWISDEEVENISQHLQITKEAFLKKYTRMVGGRLSLLEVRANGQYDCIFLRDRKCLVYPVRPKQCQTFPWWNENVSSKEAWDETKNYCEGIDHPDAPLFTLEDIEKNLSS